MTQTIEDRGKEDILSFLLVGAVAVGIAVGGNEFEKHERKGRIETPYALRDSSLQIERIENGNYDSNKIRDYKIPKNKE